MYFTLRALQVLAALHRNN